MKKEKILSKIEKYLAGDVLLLFLGLIHSEDGVRGFPFAWLGGGVDNGRFILSALVLSAVVICADVIARSITAAKEPKMQSLTKAVRAGSSYAAGAPPQKRTPKPVKTVSPSVRGMGHTAAAKPDKGIEIGHISLPEISERTARGPAKALSNGAGMQRTGTGGGNSSKVMATAIIIIFIAFSLITTVFVALESGVDFDSDSIIADDEYDDTMYDDAYDETCRTYIDYLFIGYNNEYNNEAEAMLAGSYIIEDAIDWDEDEGYYSCDSICSNYLYDRQRIERYRLETDGGDYIIAFLLDSDADISGAAVCGCPEDDAFSEFGTLRLGDGSLTGDEEAQLAGYVEEHAAEAGVAEFEEVSILLY